MNKTYIYILVFALAFYFFVLKKDKTETQKKSQTKPARPTLSGLSNAIANMPAPPKQEITTSTGLAATIGQFIAQKDFQTREAKLGGGIAAAIPNYINIKKGAILEGAAIESESGSQYITGFILGTDKYGVQKKFNIKINYNENDWK